MEVVDTLVKLNELHDKYGPNSSQVEDFMKQYSHDEEILRLARISIVMRRVSHAPECLTFKQGIGLTLLNLTVISIVAYMVVQYWPR